MRVLLTGAHGRLGGRVLSLLLARGHAVRALVRSEEQAGALRAAGSEVIVGDLRGDVEWMAERCEAVVFAAGARRRADLAAVDGGGAAKLAEAAFHYEHSRFLLCSVIGADRPERRQGGVREFMAAKRHAERRLAPLNMPWTVLRFGRLTDAPGDGRIATAAGGGPLTLSRDDAALVIVEALVRPELAYMAIPVVDGDRAVADVLEAVPPRPPPAPAPVPTGRVAPLGAAQADNPPDAPDMIVPGAEPIDADVEWEGDGPVPPEPVGDEDPAPGIP